MPLDFHSATDAASGRAADRLDWYQATEPDQQVTWGCAGYMRRVNHGTADGGDLLGWATLVMAAPALLVATLLTLAWIGA